MSEDRSNPTADELRSMLRASGLQLTEELFNFTLRSQAAFEALVARVRKGVGPTDEPACTFSVPKSPRKPTLASVIQSSKEVDDMR